MNRGKRRRQEGAMTPVCCMLEILERYDSNESTTAFTRASRASETLQERERSIAAQTDRGHQ